jgi:glycosyltransferase involved in cell wall biosynthesis
MRVAILGDYPRDPSTIGGGVEAVICYLLQGLRQYPDLDIHVVTLCEDVSKYEAVRRGSVTAHYVPAAYRFGKVTFFIRNKLRLRRVLRSIQPDLIHAHVAGTYSEVAFGMGWPAVLTLHGIRYREATFRRSWLDQKLRYLLVRREERVGIQVARYIISINPYVEQEFRSILRGRVYRIENPVSDSFFNLPDQEQPFRLLYVGHIKPLKGIYPLIQAMPMLRDRFSKVELHLAGEVMHSHDPGYFQTIQDFIHEHQLQDHVQFTGRLNDETLLKEYAECAALVHPSLQETSPLAIGQAMAAGKPVVATRVGGIPHLISHEQTGLLVEPDDVRGLVEAITRVLSDSELRRRWGQQAKSEASRRFRTDVVARETYNVYRQILATWIRE